jgi:hypothetical protein
MRLAQLKKLSRWADSHVHGNSAVGSSQCGGGGGGGGKGLDNAQVGIQKLQLDRLPPTNGDHGARVDLICPVGLPGSDQFDRDRIRFAVVMSTHVSRPERL